MKQLHNTKWPSNINMIKKNLVHIVPSLNTGGAEVFTVSLLKVIDRSKYNVSLISLYNPPSNNSLSTELQRHNIPHYFLNKRSGFDPAIIIPLGQLLAKLNANIIHSHMHTIKYIFFSMFGSRSPAWVHTVHTFSDQEFRYPEKKQ